MHISTCEAIFHHGSYNHVEPIWSTAFWGSAEVMSKVYFTALVSIKASTSILILPEPCIVYEPKVMKLERERRKEEEKRGENGSVLRVHLYYGYRHVHVPSFYLRFLQFYKADHPTYVIFTYRPP